MPNKKRVLFILPSLTVGGLERVQVTIANSLASKGFDVTVLMLNPIYDLATDLDKRVNLVYKPYKPHKILGKLPYIRNKFYDDGMWETRATPKQLYKYYVGKEKFDIEIGFFRGLSVKIISGSTNKESVKIAWVHNDFKRCCGITANFKNLNQTKKAYSKFNKIICVSDQAKLSFEGVIGCREKTICVYNMLPINSIREMAKQKANIDKNKFTIVSVGRLVEAKGYDRLIKASKRLLDDGFEFDIWLVGDGSYRKDLEAIIHNENINNVYLLGQQANPYKYISRADLYVCASIYEGYNLTVAEAMILGIPVLSTDCTGPNEILANGEYGYITDNSEDGLYSGIKNLLLNRDKLELIKQKTKERLNFFDEEVILDKIVSTFGER